MYVCIENLKDVYPCFIDYSKAYADDTVIISKSEDQ